MNYVEGRIAYLHNVVEKAAANGVVLHKAAAELAELEASEESDAQYERRILSVR